MREPSEQSSGRIAFVAMWQQFSFEELLTLLRYAEAKGYEAAYIDGDVSVMPSRGEAPVLDGWTVQTALTSATRRIQLASIRLVHHWNAAHLAQAAATLEHLAPGRQRFLIGVGGQTADARFGLPWPRHAERVAWLDETLDALRRLWSGEAVHSEGRFVRLSGAKVRSKPSPAPRIEVAGAHPRTLRVLARQADAWNINLPPVAKRVAEASAALEAACREAGRAPGDIERSMWLFARPGMAEDDPRALAEFRRFHPWWSAVPDEELRGGLLVGDPDACRARLAALCRELQLDLPALDITGLPLEAAKRALDVFAPGAP